MPTIPQKVLDLVDTFARNQDDYLSNRFNEAMVRQQFINPLFKALGWDMDNEQGHAEAYKDVIHEASLKIGGETKAPDYCFRIGGTPKFYLEAKKPSVNLKDDPAPAFQLRRYGWSKKLPLSVLTDFEEFAVYDCRVRPAQDDKASAARVLYVRYTDFAKQWDAIADVFSRDAILKGSFDKYADSKKAKRGTATVDAAFLDEIEAWREELAKNIALRNPQISPRELNYAVQITIDRIIFLRMCEDRGIERYGQLRSLLAHADIYDELVKIYAKADQRYNSGLFHFDKEPGRAEAHDALTPNLVIDDKVFKHIFKGLYYPDSPYEFSVLPSEILGQVYEQFLGKVIRLTAGHQAKIEEKPEVKKAGGVYYTPTYIVDYIVQHTVGKLLEGKSIKQAAKLRVLDPSCGSGSFLLGAYSFLLKWHLQQFVAEGPDKHKKALFQDSRGEWRLTTRARKDILVNNVFGVDIDSQAVEVTKLSLLLKVLEGESQQTLDQQTLLYHERALPDLASNIKCGNSLIGPDFYAQEQPELFDEDEQFRINVFDWNAAFPDIMKAGGFDAVIGNPPYGAYFGKSEAAYLREKYRSPANSLDSFIIFVEQSSSLLRQQGYLGFIIPSGWVSTPSSEPLRRIFLDLYLPASFVSLPFGVFSDAYIDTVILTATKIIPSKRPVDDHVDLIVFPFRYTINGIEDFDQFRKTATYTPWTKMKRVEFLITCDDNESRLLQKIQSQPEILSSFVHVKRGVEVYNPAPNRANLSKPELAFTGVLQRYNLQHGDAGYISYDAEIRKSKPFEYFSNRRILLRQVLSRKLRLQAVVAEDAFLTNQSVQSLILNESHSDTSILFFLLGVLNSKMLSWYFKNSNSVARRDDFPKIIIQQTRELPICEIGDFQDPSSASAKTISTVRQIVGLQNKFNAARTPHEKTVLQAQIDATDRQIDQMVYELYGLTADEIKIVEDAVAS